MNDKGEFVIRLHHAKRAGVHHDLHLDGESWAVPKLVPTAISQGKRLAIRTAYHSPEQARFSGEIEEGYGAGTSEVADEGEFTIISSSPKHIFLKLYGNTYRGNYYLRYWRDSHWLIWRRP